MTVIPAYAGMTVHYALARLRAAAGRRMMPAMQNPNSTRTSALHRAAPQWKRQLLEVTGRNRLLNYRDLKSGTIDLTPAPDSGMDARVLDTLLVGKPVRMTALFPVGDGDEDTQKDARKRFSAIHKQARELVGGGRGRRSGGGARLDCSGVEHLIDWRLPNAWLGGYENRSLRRPPS